jgi:hypothetical protein
VLCRIGSLEKDSEEEAWELTQEGRKRGRQEDMAKGVPCRGDRKSQGPEKRPAGEVEMESQGRYHVGPWSQWSGLGVSL